MGRKKNIKIVDIPPDVPINNVDDHNLYNNYIDNTKIDITNEESNKINQVQKINDIKMDDSIKIKQNKAKEDDKVKPKTKTKTSYDKNSNDFLKELLTNQLKNVNPTKRLNYNDIKRISKFLSSSIFDPNQCALWNGYITNEKNQSKGTYINFYFNQKKIALHRLLYLNFIGDILNTEYLKFSCQNKGKCCNIHHLKKYSYNSTTANSTVPKANQYDNSVHINRDKESLTVEL
jgi:hypothetical protein